MSLRGRRHDGGGQNVLEIIENVQVDNQFSGPKHIRWSAALGKLLVANKTYLPIRNSDLSFFTKVATVGRSEVAIDSDSTDVYYSFASLVYKHPINILYSGSPPSNVSIASIRMIDASGDPDYVYVTSNNAADGHGVRKIRKSDMTVVASILSTGSGNGQFNNPLGIKYVTESSIGYVYVCDYDNTRIVKLLASDLSYVTSFILPVKPNDLTTDGTNWWLATANFYLHKYDYVFTDATKTYTTINGAYSVCYIPDQSDGNDATVCVVSNSGNCLYRRKCSDLSAINSVGSSGDGSSSLEDFTFQTTKAIDIIATCDDGISQVMTRTGAEPTVTHALSMNGFAAAFHRTPGPHKWTFKVNGGAGIVTAFDCNTDAIVFSKNLSKLANITSYKAQSNVGMVLDLSQLSSKLVTLWAYGCGTGITGSIRHMIVLSSVNLRENSAPQAQVDQWIGDLYANKDILGTPVINVNGSNVAPSAAGKAQADELVNDYGWTFAYTT